MVSKERIRHLATIAAIERSSDRFSATAGCTCGSHPKPNSGRRSCTGAHAGGRIGVPVPESFRPALDNEAYRAYADLTASQLLPQCLDYRFGWLQGCPVAGC